MKPNNKKKYIVLLVGVAIIAVIVYFSTAGGNDSVEVSAMKVEYGNVNKTIDISGILYAKDYEEITPDSGVKVTKVYIEEGQLVEAGDVLAELDSTELSISLNKANINLEQIESELESSRSSASSSEKRILQNSINKTNEAYIKSEKDLNLSQENLENTKILYENGAISKADFESQILLNENYQTLRNTALLNYEAAKINLYGYQEGLGDLVEQLERQKQQVLLDIENIKRKIDDTVIRSSINGTVTEFPIKELREIDQQSRIVIQNLEEFELKSMVPQEDAIIMKAGQSASILVKGLANEFKGKILTIAKNADYDTSSGSSTPKVEVSIAVEKPEEVLVAGFDADATVETDTVENVLVVKNEAIRNDSEGKTFVYLVIENKAVKSFIDVGITDGYLTQIVSGIEEGNYIILNPSEEVTDGISVKLLN